MRRSHSAGSPRGYGMDASWLDPRLRGGRKFMSAGGADETKLDPRIEQLNLLLAFVCFQNGFLDQKSLDAILDELAEDGSSPLGPRLVARGHLDPNQLELLQSLAR